MLNKRCCVRYKSSGLCSSRICVLRGLKYGIINATAGHRGAQNIRCYLQLTTYESEILCLFTCNANFYANQLLHIPF